MFWHTLAVVLSHQTRFLAALLRARINASRARKASGDMSASASKESPLKAKLAARRLERKNEEAVRFSGALFRPMARWVSFFLSSLSSASRKLVVLLIVGCATFHLPHLACSGVVRHPYNGGWRAATPQNSARTQKENVLATAAVTVLKPTLFAVANPTL
jgi:hypothetical protein